MGDVLQVTGLGKRFGSLEVLRDIGFKVSNEESLAVLGPSGCGKTTLLRILLGLEAPDVGSISNPLDRAGYLPQESRLFPWKRVFENIELPLLLQGASREDRRRMIRPLLTTFGLEGFESSYPHQLSGGMRQRVALLRAVIAGATTLILDEPFGALDTVTRHHLQDWLVETMEQLTCSMIFVTHDPEEAIVLSHRTLVLSKRPASVVGQITSALTAAERRDRMSLKFLDARATLVDLIVTQGEHAHQSI